jgi:hypothetical protein
MDIPGADHDSPPGVLALAAVGVEGPRPGTYSRTGEQRDGRWVYALESVA